MIKRLQRANMIILKGNYIQHQLTRNYLKDNLLNSMEPDNYYWE